MHIIREMKTHMRTSIDVVNAAYWCGLSVRHQPRIEKMLLGVPRQKSVEILMYLRKSTDERKKRK